MSQGERPKQPIRKRGKAWNRDEVIETLRPFFELGCSVTKACAYAGIPQPTVACWLKDNHELQLKINAWQNKASALARENWLAKIKEQDYSASKEWLERKEKDEFSQRQEVTGEDGSALLTIIKGPNPYETEEGQKLLPNGNRAQPKTGSGL